MMIIKKIAGKTKRGFERQKQYGSFWNLVHGFTKETIELNGITRKNYHSFLDDRRYRSHHPYNGHFSSIIDNKMYLPYLLKDFQEYVPRYFFYISKGDVLSLTKDYNHGFESFMNMLGSENLATMPMAYCPCRGIGLAQGLPLHRWSTTAQHGVLS